MIPAVFISLPALPLTPNGKVNRRALPAPEAMARSLQSHYVAPRDTVELQLVPIWEDLLNVHPIGIQDNFFELGGHSLLAVRLMAQIERQFKKRLQLASLFQGATIEQQARLLHQHTQGEEAWSALVPIQAKGSQPPFFGLAGAGGHVLYFYELARHLSSDQPFYGLQPRGLDGDSSPHATVEEIATYYIETMRVVQPHGPYRLGGHSFGGWVAYEMAQQLRKQGEEVALLAILDTPAPRPVKPQSAQDDWDEAQWLTHLSRIMGHLYNVSLSVTEEALRELAPEAQLRYVHDQLKQAQILPQEASIKPFRGIVAVYKANVRTHYFPKDAVPVPLTLFRARDAQPEPLAVEEAQNRELLQDPAYGWSGFGEVTMVEVPGDHLTMLNAPQVEVLAGRLMEGLQRY
jgi:thioesterase domain-containing protein/acyl carrier protein